MATERFIRGKCDDAKHDGRRSNVLREQQASQSLLDGLAEVEGDIYEARITASRRMQTKHWSGNLLVQKLTNREVGQEYVSLQESEVSRQ